MSTTTFGFTSPTEITFAVNKINGTITINHGTTSIVINKDSGTRKWSVKTVNNVLTFVEEEGNSARITNNWPTFLMPFNGDGNCDLSLKSFANSNYPYSIIGTDDIRYTAINECTDAYWDIYNPDGSNTKCIELRINQVGPNFRLRVRHSSHNAASAPAQCGNFGGSPAVCITKHV